YTPFGGRVQELHKSLCFFAELSLPSTSSHIAEFSRIPYLFQLIGANANGKDSGKFVHLFKSALRHQ
ncbi:hypothetical protein E2320_008262, partial [Naja naja]